ncbi:MAG: hypothetical protein NTU88_15915, partial [Armatimonadetes bacterium]|nr:hypothetical protein [Armatimonadota bacterium]
MKVLVIACILALACASVEARVLLKVQGDASGRNLLANPGLEQGVEGWKGFGKAFHRDDTVRRSGKASIRCENTT